MLAPVMCTHFAASPEHFWLILLEEPSAPHPGLVFLSSLGLCSIAALFKAGEYDSKSREPPQISVNDNLH